MINNNQSGNDLKGTKKSSSDQNDNNTNNCNTNNTLHKSKSTPIETEQDRECLKIIKKKDYYDILEVKKRCR